MSSTRNTSDPFSGRATEAGGGGGVGGRPREYFASYSHAISLLMQLSQGFVPEHRVFFDLQ